MRLMREATLRRELHKTIDASEELDLHRRVHGDEEGVVLEQLDEHLARREAIQTALQRNASFTHSPEPRHRRPAGPSCCARVLSSTVATVFQRSLNGLITIWLYFADGTP